jgi:methylated-DNA-protein-cysteine methyltransferase-like protein
LSVEQIELWARRIPRGQVLSYGDLGALCEPPISGYICGRLLQSGTDDVPWWRIVARDGTLSIAKRNPQLAARQRALLTEEGVQFTADGRVDMARYRRALR